MHGCGFPARRARRARRGRARAGDGREPRGAPAQGGGGSARRAAEAEAARSKAAAGDAPRAAATPAHLAPQNLDVAKEADDVLAIAGVNADDEARYMFGDDDVNREDTHADFTPKASWRKLIELRVFARVAGEDGVAARAGVPHVHEKVYEYVEEALQARLKGFVARVCVAAKHRNDGNRKLFPRDKMSVVEPRAAVRRVNVDAERDAAARAEKERQRLLRVGETFLSKRKRARGGEDAEDDAELKEKVARVQAEEEERQRAETANQAAQAALGADAKYLKWAEAAKAGDGGATRAAPTAAPRGDPDAEATRTRRVTRLGGQALWTRREARRLGVRGRSRRDGGGGAQRGVARLRGGAQRRRAPPRAASEAVGADVVIIRDVRTLATRSGRLFKSETRTSRMLLLKIYYTRARAARVGTRRRRRRS